MVLGMLICAQVAGGDCGSHRNGDEQRRVARVKDQADPT